MANTWLPSKANSVRMNDIFLLGPRAHTEEYTALIKAGDADGIMTLLTDKVGKGCTLVVGMQADSSRCLGSTGATGSLRGRRCPAAGWS